MNYKYISQFDIAVKKIDNGFIVQVQNPDVTENPSTFFADELNAYEFAATKLAEIIEGLKNEA